MSSATSARFEMKPGDELGRKKIKISRITSQKSRQVTFNKRKVGLMKKAMELSILCECEIAIILFDHQKQLYQYCTRNTGSGMEQLISRWKAYDGNYEALSNGDLQTLKPGRAASFRVGKKRKAAGGKAVPVKSSGKAAAVDYDSEDASQYDEDEEEESSAPDGKSEAPEPRATGTYKHTSSHPLHSPSSHPTDFAQQLKPMASHSSLANPALANTVHPLLTPLGPGHSFSSMLSPTNLSSATSLGANNFGSSYPFNGTPTPPNALQQVLSSQQASLLSPSSGTNQSAAALFGPSNTTLANMSPTQIQQLSQQLHQQQQQQQGSTGSMSSRLTEQQHQQQQQLASLTAQHQQQQQQYNDSILMAKLMQQQQQQQSTSPYGSHGRSPTITNALNSLTGSPQSNGSASNMLGPPIPPSPVGMYQPLQSPAFSSNPYNLYLSQHQQGGSSHTSVQAMHAANTAHLLHQQQQQHYQQLQQQQQLQLQSGGVPKPLSPLAQLQARSNPILSMSMSAANAATASALAIRQAAQAANAATESSVAMDVASSSASDSLTGLASIALPNASLLSPSSSSSSLLAKRTPFKIPLSLEIPTKSNVSGGGDITNAAAAAEDPNGQDAASVASSSDQQPGTMTVMVEEPTSTTGASHASRAPSQAPHPHHQIPVSAPAGNSIDGSTMSMSLTLPSHTLPMSAYGNAVPYYSPMTSPSTFLSGEQQAMLFNVTNGGLQGLGMQSAGTTAPSAAQSQSMHLSTPAGGPPMHPMTQHHLRAPASPYGTWQQSFAGGMDQTSTAKIYSPTAMRSPVTAAALFARTFQ